MTPKNEDFPWTAKFHGESSFHNKGTHTQYYYAYLNGQPEEQDGLFPTVRLNSRMEIF